MKDRQCTCPHQYTKEGLIRAGTDVKCVVHGERKLPDEAAELRQLLARANGVLAAQSPISEPARQLVQEISAKLGITNPLVHT